MSILVKVNGSTVLADIGTLRWNLAAGKRGTASCLIKSMDGSYRPLTGQTFTIEVDGTREFGGVLRLVQETGFKNADRTAHILRLEAVDNSTLFGRRVVSTLSTPEGTLKAVLRDYVMPYVSGYGMTLSGSQPDGPTLPAMTFSNTTLVDVVTKIVEAATALSIEAAGDGYVAQVDEFNVFSVTELGAVSAPNNLVDNDGNSYGEIEIEDNLTNYANRLIGVFGGSDRVVKTQYVRWGDREDLGDGFLYFTVDYPAYNDINSVWPNELWTSDSGEAGPFNPFGPMWWLPGQAPPLGSLVWGWDPVNHRLRYDPAIGGAIPAGVTDDDTVLRLEYTAQFPFFVQAPPVADEPTAQQTARGLVEAFFTKPEIKTIEAATPAVQAALAARCPAPRLARYETFNVGLKPGMVQHLTVAQRGVDADFFIIEVMAWQDSEGKRRRKVTLTEGASVPIQWRDSPIFLGGSLNTGGGTTIINNGSPNTPTVPADKFRSTTVRLTNAQIKELPNTAVELIPAQGPTKRIVWLHAVVTVDTAAGAYTNLQDDYCALYLGIDNFSYDWATAAADDVTAPYAAGANGVLDRLTQLMGVTGVHTVRALAGDLQSFLGESGWALQTVFDASDLANKNFAIKGDNNGGGAWTGGHDDNSMTVTVYWCLEDLTVPVRAVPAGSLLISMFSDDPWEAYSHDGQKLPTLPASIDNSGGVGMVSVGDYIGFCLANDGNQFGRVDYDMGNYTTAAQSVSGAYDSLARGINAFWGPRTRVAPDRLYAVKVNINPLVEASATLLITTSHDGHTPVEFDLMAISPDESIAYIAVRDQSGRTGTKVYKVVLSGPTISTFVTLPTGSVTWLDWGLLCLADGSLLVGVDNNTLPGQVLRYSAAGNLIRTYELPSVVPGTKTSPIVLTRAVDDDEFWVSYYDDNIGTHSDTRYMRIKASTGEVLDNWTPEDGLKDFDGPFCVLLRSFTC